ncbi:MAG: hypothetical protein VYE22_16815 [Myxococcota bacterium]|nr:hypothetical protein [Myxococcota bacterium]
MRMTMAELFERLHALPRSLSGVSLDSRPLTGQSVVMVYDLDALEPDEDRPADATRLGLTRDLSVATVVDVVRNAQQQGLAPTLQEFVEGVAYYAERDAFKEWRARRSEEG